MKIILVFSASLVLQPIIIIIKKGNKMDRIVCAVFDETCPYCDEEGYCRMEEDEGLLPFDECDAFYVFEEEES